MPVPEDDAKPLLAAAHGGDQDAFRKLTDPFRRELLVHCYRLLGSTEDAEDLLQDTLIRAWRGLATFTRDVSFRAWLYKIATNACLSALAKRPRRGLPDAFFPAADARQPLLPPIVEPIWLQPFPDEWLPGAAETADPETHYTRQESISLAFVIALQLLPPRQRAVLILCDVLDWRAAEAADLLEMTTAAVNSSLFRARATLAKNRSGAPPAAAGDAASQRLLQQFVRAMQEADIAGIVALLKQDAVFTMPPIPSWYLGLEAVQVLLTNLLFAGDAAGRWRTAPAQANLQPTLALYQRDDSTGRHRPFALQVFTLDAASGLIKQIDSFSDPALFPSFGLPPEL